MREQRSDIAIDLVLLVVGMGLGDQVGRTRRATSARSCWIMASISAAALIDG